MLSIGGSVLVPGDEVRTLARGAHAAEIRLAEGGSLVLGPDHAPLSKRHGATSVAEFTAQAKQRSRQSMRVWPRRLQR